MTSANFFNGYAVDKPSSKVLNPPGGKSNNIFGFSNEEDPKSGFRQKTQAQIDNNNARQASTVFSDSHNNANLANHNKNKRTGYNPITGESYDQGEPKVNQTKKEEPVQVAPPPPVQQPELTNPEEPGYKPKPIHTSSKVLQPPGGKSTKLW